MMETNNDFIKIIVGDIIAGVIDKIVEKSVHDSAKKFVEQVVDNKSAAKIDLNKTSRDAVYITQN